MTWRRVHRTASACAALVLGWVTLTGGWGEANAAEEVAPTGKGIAGGILLGAEIVTIPMGLAGVRAGWPYLVFGGLGAVGGGIGGYFVETVTVAPGPTEVPLYMLAGGMALVIPAVVISLNATTYRPPPEDSSEPVTNQPAAEPPTPKPSGRVNRKPMRQRVGATDIAPGIPMSLVGVYPNHISLGIPALTIKSTFTPREIAELGAPKATEVHIPIFQAVF